MDKNKVFMCNACGTHFEKEMSGECPCCCIGVVKSYNENGAFLKNTLDRACYKISEFKIPGELDKSREIHIVFDEPTYFKPPKGFTFERGSKQISSEGKEYWSKTSIHKAYRADMPAWKYVLELAQDKARLTKWVFDLERVKVIMQY